MKRKFAALVLIVILVACFTLPSSVNAADKLSLNKKKVSLGIDNTFKLKLGKTKATSVTWWSGDKSIATVSKWGTVTAKKEGTVKITAKYNEKRYTCFVTVIKNNNSMTPTPIPPKEEGVKINADGTAQTAKESGRDTVVWSGNNSNASGKIGKVAWISGIGLKVQSQLCSFPGFYQAYDGALEDYAYAANNFIIRNKIPDAGKMSESEARDWLEKNYSKYKDSLTDIGAVWVLKSFVMRMNGLEDLNFEDEAVIKWISAISIKYSSGTSTFDRY